MLTSAAHTKTVQNHVDLKVTSNSVQALDFHRTEYRWCVLLVVYIAVSYTHLDVYKRQVIKRSQTLGHLICKSITQEI